MSRAFEKGVRQKNLPLQNNMWVKMITIGAETTNNNRFRSNWLIEILDGQIFFILLGLNWK